MNTDSKNIFITIILLFINNCDREDVSAHFLHEYREKLDPRTRKRKKDFPKEPTNTRLAQSLDAM